MEWRQPEVFDVLDPRGRFLGTVVLPLASQVVYAKGAYFWTIEHGEFEEQYLVRYRAERLGVARPAEPRDGASPSPRAASRGSLEDPMWVAAPVQTGRGRR